MVNLSKPCDHVLGQNFQAKPMKCLVFMLEACQRCKCNTSCFCNFSLWNNLSCAFVCPTNECFELCEQSQQGNENVLIWHAWLQGKRWMLYCVLCVKDVPEDNPLAVFSGPFMTSQARKKAPKRGRLSLLNSQRLLELRWRENKGEKYLKKKKSMTPQMNVSW